MGLLGFKWLSGGLGVALIAVCALSALIIFGLRTQLTLTQNELGTARVRVAALEGANLQCKDSIVAQNKHVSHWVTVMGNAAQSAEIAARNSWGAVKRAQTVSDELRAQQSTGNLEEDCRRLNQNLDEAIKRRLGQ